MKSLCVLLAGLALCTGLFAQNTGGITGIVFDAQTRQPIIGATVCCYVANTHTDSAGRYLISGLAAGRYKVRAIATGYVTGYYPESVEVLEGRVTHGIDFALSRTGQQHGCILGIVSDAENRQVIIGARLLASGPHGAREAAQGELGYRIDSLLAGKYWVTAGAEGYEPGHYPESVVVVAGQATQYIDFSLVPTGGQNGGISGRVINARTREPIRGASVTCQNRHNQATVQTCSLGFYRVEVPAGRYQVCCRADGFEPAVYPESVIVVEGRITPEINFALVPTGGGSGGISGWVFNIHTRQPIEGAIVNCGAGQARTGRDGRYLIDGLQRGRYQVRCEATGYRPAVYPESVTVLAGQVTENINFHLEPLSQQYGAISGQVMNSATRHVIIGALVTASNTRLRRSVTQTSAGYRIPELPAGRYWVSATARDFEPGHYPESVLVVVGRVTDGITFHLDPVSNRTGGISGFVVNARSREPILGALVIAQGPSRGRANTCQRGGYIIRDLLPGRYQVVAGARGFLRSAVETVEVAAGRITPEVNFALQPEPGGSGAIMGHVRDSVTRSGIPNAEVLARGEAGQGWAMTESTGGYVIPALRAGAYRVRALARGYYPKTFPDTVFVVQGETTRSVNFHLRPAQRPGGGISGFAFDGMSEAEVAGARLTFIGATGSLEAFADENGDYVMDGLEPGAYEIEAGAEGYENGLYPEPVLVEDGVISALICPALYPLTGVLEQARLSPRAEQLLVVEPTVCQGRATIRLLNPGTRVELVTVLDRSGRLVRTLQVPERTTPQPVSVYWDGTNDAGTLVGSGVYFLRTSPEQTNGNAKLVLVAR